MARRKVHYRPLLALFTLALMIIACECAPRIDRALLCMIRHSGDDVAQMEACLDYVEALCPTEGVNGDDPVQLYLFRLCLHENFPDEWGPPEYPPTPTPLPTPSGGNADGGGQSVGAPGDVVNPQNSGGDLASSQVNCAPFQLTSPLDGLPNGVATFFWNPLPEATGYQIVASADRSAMFSAGAGESSVSGDVSQAAIGGLYTVNITALALVDGEAVCSVGVTLPRAADANLAQPDDDDDDEPEPAPTDPEPG